VEISWQAELERAARETGLDDFGGEGFHAGLKAFSEAINRDPKMSPEVKERTRGMINGTLVKRLNLYRGTGRPTLPKRSDASAPASTV